MRRLSNLDFVSLEPYRIDGRVIDPVDPEVVNCIGVEWCEINKAIPLQLNNGVLLVGAIEPSTLSLSDLSSVYEEAVEIVPVDPTEFLAALTRIRADAGKSKIGEILIGNGKLTSEELKVALDSQNRITNRRERLGALLTGTNVITHWDLAEAIAVQKDLPLVNLLSQESVSHVIENPQLKMIWERFSEKFWYRHLVTPLGISDNILSVAMVDPEDLDAVALLHDGLDMGISVSVTGYRDVLKVLEEKFGQKHEVESRQALLESRPQDSAIRQLSRAQTVVFSLLASIILLSMILYPKMTGLSIAGILEILYMLAGLLRLWLMQEAVGTVEADIVTNVDLEKSLPRSLPSYTILVPLYKEASVIPIISEAIRRLDYPKDRLDVKFLLEESDLETIDAAKSAQLPGYIHLTIIPESEPKTKPKACNYGLSQARGDYLVIYDAEDIPDSDQLLKAIATFRLHQDEQLACVQAKLSYFNDTQNLITRWFTAEYANWFELVLPGLFKHRMPIPLGGTSNHFRTDVLRELGAWDPYNVTEDADLGIRLHKAGYRTAVVNSTTHEEANAYFVNWIRQRSRWIKGYMQTWLVHMRRPIHLIREIGWRDFIIFNLLVGGSTLQFVLNPVFWAMTLLWFVLGANFVQEIFAGWVYYLGMLSMILGNVAFAYASIIGAYKAGKWHLAISSLLIPIYWTFMSIAAWKAVYQLAVKPSYWEKTMHGLSGTHSQSKGGFHIADV